MTLQIRLAITRCKQAVAQFTNPSLRVKDSRPETAAPPSQSDNLKPRTSGLKPESRDPPAQSFLL